MDYTRLPPKAPELEEAVLGAIMLERDAIDTVTTILTPEAFYQEAHQRIYRVMVGMWNKSQPIEVPTVVDKLREGGELDVVGGAYYVTKLTNAVVSTISLEYNCRKILEKFMQREMIRVGGQIYNAGFDQRADVFDSLDDAEQSLLAISKTIQNDTLSVETVLMKTVTQIEEWGKIDGTITGVPSGFPTLDRATRGWQPGNLIILAARPSVGKTAMALRLARNAAKNQIRSFPVAIWSLEMKSTQLMLRLLAAESDINLHYLQTGKMDDAQKVKMHRYGVNELAKMKIFFDDASGLSIMQLRAKARRLKRKHNIGLIIIDYLQLMSGQGNTREQEISGNTRQLKTLAQELEIPIIALSQLSRDVEKRTGAKRMPQLSDLRESGAIEQDADDVLFLYGPDQEDIDKDASLLGARKLRIAKARNGLLATIDLEFNGQTQFFKEHTETGFKPVASLSMF